LLLCGPVGWIFGCSSPLLAAVANVSIVDYAFSPSSVAINVNDVVKWTWASDYHSTTSSGGLWDSGVYSTGYTYNHTFSTTGSFPYICSIHYFMGTVVVQGSTAPPPPPTVSITSPPNGSVLSAPASLTLKASVADSGGNVTNVQFFQGTTSLGSVETVPYSKIVTGLPAGNYTFAAVVMDNNGFSATNAVTVKVITPTVTSLSGLQRVSPTGFKFTYAADVGLSYVVQQSVDLKNWNSVSTNTAVSNQAAFQDTAASESARFYRVGRLPNP
jgi:hypothetical protein